MEKIKKVFTEDRLEIIIAIFLGITALLTAWASWISGLHGGNQATNYTTSNNLSATGNSMYNEAEQQFMQDSLLWNDISDLQIEYQYEIDCENYDAAELAAYKLYYKCYDNLQYSAMCDEIGWDYDLAYEYSEDPIRYIEIWLEQDEAMISPLYDENFVDSYFEEADEVLEEAEEVLAQGKQDNAYGDAYNLVTVVYSLVLFILGIVGIFKRLPNRYILALIAIATFFLATIYMIMIPLPTGFSLSSFFIS